MKVKSSPVSLAPEVQPCHLHPFRNEMSFSGKEKWSVESDPMIPEATGQGPAGPSGSLLA